MLKQILLSFFFVFSFVTSYSQTGEPKAEIKFEKETHDFGTINEGQSVTYEFKVMNTGKSPLVLQSIQPSCGCVTVAWTKDPIRPNGSGYIRATFHSMGKPGTFHKTITVTSNASRFSAVLSLKGEVNPTSFEPQLNK